MRKENNLPWIHKIFNFNIVLKTFYIHLYSYCICKEILNEIHHWNELWQTGMSSISLLHIQITNIKQILTMQSILIVIEHWVYLLPLSTMNFFRQGVIKYTVKTFLNIAFREKTLWFHTCNSVSNTALKLHTWRLCDIIWITWSHEKLTY